MTKRNKSKNLALGTVLIVDIKKYNRAITIITFLLLICAYYLMTLDYTKLVRVKGVVSTTKGVVNVPAPQSGYVKSSYFNVNDAVTKGSVLFNISTEKQTSKLLNLDLDSAIIDKLSKSKSLKLSQITNNKDLLKLDVASKKKELDFKLKEIEIQKESLGLHEKIISITKDKADKVLNLSKSGSIGLDAYKIAYKSYIETEIDYKELLLKLKFNESRVLVLERDIEQLPIQLRILQNKLNESIIELDRQIIDVSSRKEYSIIAPIDGIQATLPFNEGETVSAGDIVATLIPKNSLHHAVLFIEPHQIGFIEPGQRVSIRFSAFPYQHFGLQYGVIEKVSTAISRSDTYDEISKSQYPTYKIIVKLDSQIIVLKDKSFPLREGMTLEATVKLESRTLIEWLFNPILSLRGKL